MQYQAIANTGPVSGEPGRGLAEEESAVLPCDCKEKRMVKKQVRPLRLSGKEKPAEVAVSSRPLSRLSSRSHVGSQIQMLACRASRDTAFALDMI